MPEADVSNDAKPASWIEILPPRVRWRAFAWRAGIGLFLAVALWILEYRNGTLSFGNLWFGATPLCIGLFFGALAYRKCEVRRYKQTYVSYTHRERIKRASKWWVCGLVLLALAWGTLLEQGKFAEQWWYASPILLIFLVGMGLYRLKGETSTSSEAAKAKVQAEQARKQAEKQAEDAANAASQTVIDELMEKPLVRYIIAAALAYGAYYFGAESTSKNAGWAAAGCIALAAIFARELSKWILGLSLVGLIAWAVIAGISALPISAAIIVGAIIIASAVNK